LLLQGGEIEDLIRGGGFVNRTAEKSKKNLVELESAGQERGLTELDAKKERTSDHQVTRGPQGKHITGKGIQKGKSRKLSRLWYLIRKSATTGKAIKIGSTLPSVFQNGPNDKKGGGCQFETGAKNEPDTPEAPEKVEWSEKRGDGRDRKRTNFRKEGTQRPHR